MSMIVSNARQTGIFASLNADPETEELIRQLLLMDESTDQEDIYQRVRATPTVVLLVTWP